MADAVAEPALLAPARTKVRWDRLLGKAALCSVYAVFAIAHVQSLQEEFRLSLLLVLAFETLMVVMVAVRRDSVVTDRRPLVVVAGLLGSFVVLALRPVHGAADHLVGQALQVAGAGLQIGAALSMGRSFGVIPANRGVRTRGLYRAVRHPFYAAYLVSQVGYALNNPSAWNVGVVVLGTAFQVVRIRYEEQLLLGSGEYREYRSAVRWRLVPGVW
jgi:protein-S-isoprenylcysteine O-methyltransferase Ste14